MFVYAQVDSRNDNKIMAESIVSDWLADYAALEKSEIRTFAAQHEHNHEISNALFSIINERLKYPDVSDGQFSSMSHDGHN